MIIDNAECVWTARDKIADQLTGEWTVWSAATRLIFWTLTVGSATVLAWTLTASAIVRITGVARQTIATAAMVFRHAARIRGAGETVAERHTFEYAKRVRPASLTRMAIVVAYAIGHRRLLARRQYRIPLVAVLTLTGGMTGYNVRLAFLISAAHHFAAGIYAIAYTTV